MIAGGAFIGCTRVFAICFREVHWHSVEATIEKRGLPIMASAGPIGCDCFGLLPFAYASGRVLRGRDPALPGDRFHPGPATILRRRIPGPSPDALCRVAVRKPLHAAVFAPKGAVAIRSYWLTQKYKGFSFVSEATRAAALLEREELLTSEARHLTEASYRRRAEIEAELAEIHRLLERLGLRGG